MAAADLCSLADVKAWLGIPNANSDAVLTPLITAVSRSIMGYLNRAILPMSRTEVRDGTGTPKFMLSEWPVLSVQSLSVDGITIPACANPPFGDGYLIETVDDGPPGRMQGLTLTTRLFRRGLANVSVTYRAGYQVSGEAATIPASPYQVTPVQPYGNWASDQGVTYSDGTPLIPVPSAPATGQYSVANGVYTFASSDQGRAVLLSYGYVPADLRQACIQAVSDEFKSKDRIGIQSKSLAGQETVTYTSAMLTARVKAMLAPYGRVVQP